MRFAGALLLAVAVVAVVVETRPPLEKRGIKICSARDVKFMATFVCNLHKRSVRSIDAEDFGMAEIDDDEFSMMDASKEIPIRLLCDENGGNCGREIDPSDLSNYQLNYVKDWLAENGYIQETAAFLQNFKNIIENEKLNSRNIENGNERGNFEMIFDSVVPMKMNGLKGLVTKRRGEIDWPLIPSLTLGDIRKNCCIRQCRVEDFYGACS